MQKQTKIEQGSATLLYTEITDAVELYNKLLTPLFKGLKPAKTAHEVASKPQPQKPAATKRHGKKITQGFKLSPELFATIMNARKDGEKNMAQVVRRVLAYGIKQYDSKRVFPPLPESIARGKSTSILVSIKTLNAIKGRARMARVDASTYATQMIVAYFKNHKH